MAMQYCLDRVERYLPKFIFYTIKRQVQKPIKLYVKNSKTSIHGKLEKNLPRFYIDHNLCGLTTFNQSITSAFWRFS